MKTNNKPIVEVPVEVEEIGTLVKILGKYYIQKKKEYADGTKSMMSFAVKDFVLE